MIRMLVIYLLFGGNAMSIWYSIRVIRRGREPGATVNAILDGRREKGLLILAISVAVAYALTIVFFSIFWHSVSAWIVLAPILYVVSWSLPRRFLRNRL